MPNLTALLGVFAISLALAAPVQANDEESMNRNLVKFPTNATITLYANARILIPAYSRVVDFTGQSNRLGCNFRMKEVLTIDRAIDASLAREVAITIQPPTKYNKGSSILIQVKGETQIDGVFCTWDGSGEVPTLKEVQRASNGLLSFTVAMPAPTSVTE